MRKTRAATLRLMSLENRLAPAVAVSFLNGNLTVTGDNTANSVFLAARYNNPNPGIQVYAVPGNQRGAFTLAGGDPSQFEIAKYSKGFYAVNGNVTVNMGNSNDFVVVTMDDNGIGNPTAPGLPGNFNASLGNGADDVQIQTRTNGIATIGGMVTENGGLGADDFNFFDVEIQGLVSINGGGSGFRFDPFSGLNLPGDVVTMSDSSVQDNMLVTNSITLIDDAYGPNTIAGDLVVSNQAVSPLGNFQTIDLTPYPAGSTAKSPGTYSGLLVLQATSSVGGNVVYTGSTSNDGVYIYGNVGDNVTVVGQAGNNDLFLGDARFASGGVNGSLTFTTTNGIDRTTLFDNTFVNGKVQLNVGDGINQYFLNHAFIVNGGMGITAGNQNDVVGLVSGTVTGDQEYNMGNGNNSLTWNGAGGAGLGTGRFRWQSGGGNDALTINGTNAFDLFAYFNAGNDTFTYGLNASVASAFIDLGFGIDVYDDSQTTVTWPSTVIDP